MVAKMGANVPMAKHFLIVLLLAVWIFEGAEGQGQGGQYFVTRPPALNCPTCPPGYTQAGPPAYGMYCPQCLPISTSCARGYYLEGQQCVPCPCHVPGAPCQRGPNNEIICICPPGHIGNYCEKCAQGYIKQNSYPNLCQPVQQPCIGGQCKPYPELPVGCPELPGYQWPNCTFPIIPQPQPLPFPYPPPYPPPQPAPWPPINPILPSPYPCPPCPDYGYRPPPIYPPILPPQPPPIYPPILPPPQPPQIYCPPCPPRQPPIIIPQPQPCPVNPICPYPIPRPIPQPCPVPQICPMPIPPTIRCPIQPICPIPLPEPRPTPCPVPQICPIPFPECNSTCNCNCQFDGPEGILFCPPCHCDPRGTLIQDQKSCLCKKNVEGAFCDTCKPGYFSLRHSNPDGCMKCFCAGVSDQCKFAPMYRVLSSCTISSEVTLIDRDGKVLQTSSQGGVIEHRYTSSTPTGSLFWVLPRNCAGNLLTSYGLRLTATIEYTSTSGTPSVPGNDIIIEAGDFTIFWTAKKPFQPGGQVSFTAILDDTDGWMAYDNKNRTRLATRDDIMSVLAGVDRILIRATFTQINMRLTKLIGISLEQGNPVRQQSPVFTLQVEDCSCPTGYTGHSCESCSPGFYRDTTDMSHGVFGTCKRCPCKHSAGCTVGFDGVVQCLTSVNEPCEVSGPVSLTIKPYYVNCCDHEEIEFSCTYTSEDRRFDIEIITVPSSFSNLKIRQFATGISAKIPIKNLKRVVCYARTRINNVNTVVIEATSHIDARICLDQPSPPPPPPPPMIIVIATPAFACYELGQVIRMNCSSWLFTSTQLTPQWSRAGGLQLQGKAQRPQVGELVIPNAEVGDTGTYYCSASSGSIMQLATSVVVVHNKTKDYCGEIKYPFTGIQDDAPAASGGSGTRLRLRSAGSTGLLNDDANALKEGAGVNPVAPEAPAPKASAAVAVAPTEGTKPSVKIEPSILHAIEGDFVQFNCQVLEGLKEEMVFYWRKKDGSMDLDLGIINDTILAFGPIKKHHEGEYHCIATNEYGKDGDKAELIVHDKDEERDLFGTIFEDPKFSEAVAREEEKADAPPAEVEAAAAGIAIEEEPVDESSPLSITITPPGHLLRPGDQVQLRCEGGDLAGGGGMKFEWLKEDGVIRSNNANVEAGGQLLILSSLIPDDSGWYICAGTLASTGETYTTSVKLVVKLETVAPTVSISQPSPLSVKLGRKVKLECQTYGEPVPLLSWSRFINTGDGPMEQVLLESQTNQLTFEIRRASKEHEGEYFCSGKNEGGEDRVGLLVKVNEGISCAEEEYRCHSGDQCVAIDDKCDGERDCRDGSDERHCSHHKHHGHAHAQE